MDTLSIIIPSYNSNNWIHEALKSLCSTNFPVFETIIVDDCSTQFIDYDNIKNYYKELNIQIIKSDINRGAGVTRQIGLSEAKGNWVTFLDTDDEVSKNYFDILYTNIDNYDIIQQKVNPDGIEEFAIHGLIIKKQYLNKYNIQFNNFLRLGEDTYFRKLLFLYNPNILYNYKAEYYCKENMLSTTKQLRNGDIEWWFSKTAIEEELKHRMYWLSENFDMISKNIDVIRENFAVALANLKIFDYKEDLCNLIFNTFKYLYNVEDYYDFISMLNLPDETELKQIYQRWINISYEISIIIPTYNSHQYISHTIESIYNTCNLNKIQIIIVDDNSDNKNYEYLKLICPNIEIWYNNNNVRMGMNRNRGIRAAKGKYITFLDHDDIILEDITKIVENKDNDILWGGCRRNVNSPEWENSFNKDKCGLIISLDGMIELEHGIFYKRDFLKKNNIYHSNRINTSEDSYFNRVCMLYTNDYIEITNNAYYWTNHNQECINTLPYWSNKNYKTEWVLAVILALKDSPKNYSISFKQMYYFYPIYDMVKGYKEYNFNIDCIKINLHSYLYALRCAGYDYKNGFDWHRKLSEYNNNPYFFDVKSNSFDLLKEIDDVVNLKDLDVDDNLVHLYLNNIVPLNRDCYEGNKSINDIGIR